MAIDWRLFESTFWRPPEGQWVNVVLTNWRVESHKFMDSNGPKNLLCFDVLKIDREEYPIGEKVFSTGSPTVAQKLRPYIELAERNGVKAFTVMLLRNNKNTEVAPNVGV